jgi:hypothetical protein
MLDARNVYRKVTRKIYDFSPEQMKNLSAIVWLYRGQHARFLALVRDYLRQVCAASAAIVPALATFGATLADLHERFGPLAKTVESHAGLDVARKRALSDGVAELRDAITPYAVETLRRRRRTGPRNWTLQSLNVCRFSSLSRGCSVGFARAWTHSTPNWTICTGRTRSSVPPATSCSRP